MGDGFFVRGRQLHRIYARRASRLSAASTVCDRRLRLRRSALRAPPIGCGNPENRKENNELWF